MYRSHTIKVVLWRFYTVEGTFQGCFLPFPDNACTAFELISAEIIGAGAYCMSAELVSVPMHELHGPKVEGPKYLAKNGHFVWCRTRICASPDFIAISRFSVQV